MAVTQNTANQLIIVPSADAGATVLTTDVLIGVTIRWLKPTTLAHTAVIREVGNAVDVWTANCGTANADYPESFIPVIKGLVVPTLASGTLEIHYQDRKQVVAPQGTPVITGQNPLS